MEELTDVEKTFLGSGEHALVENLRYNLVAIEHYSKLLAAIRSADIYNDVHNQYSGNELPEVIEWLTHNLQRKINNQLHHMITRGIRYLEVRPLGMGNEIPGTDKTW